MRRWRAHRTTSLLAAAVYLLAIAISSVSHVHIHGLAESTSHDHCSMADCDQVAAHKHDAAHDHDAQHDSQDAPSSHDEDCNICRFLGRPLLAVTPFELAETSEHVVPLPAARVPMVPVVVVITAQARAPPSAAFSI